MDKRRQWAVISADLLAFENDKCFDSARFNGFVFAFLDDRDLRPPKRQLAPLVGAPMAA